MPDLTDDSRFNFTPEELLRLETRWKSDVDLKLDALGRRTAVIERLVWVGVGGTAVLTVISGIFISQIEKQGDAITAVAMKQAAAIAERNAHIEAIKADIRRMQDGRK
jgi:hypothetical protein